MRLLPSFKRIVLVGAALWAPALACSRTDGARGAAERVPLDRAVTWVRDIRLEENQEVINVVPRVAVAGSGSYLVGDAQENQLRIYAPDGRLRTRFGRRGSGPGEFTHVAASLRLRDGRILATDMGGALTFFDSTGANVLHTARTPIEPLYTAVELNDSILAITGRLGGSDTSALIHLWNTRSDRIVRSFFHPTPPERWMQPVYVFSGMTDIAVHGDTIATLFALKDTVFLLGTDGRRVRRIPVPARAFRRLSEPMPDDDKGEAAFRRWNASYSSATTLYWLRDGSFLVQYYDMKDAEPDWRLLHMSRDGRSRFEVVGSPRLLAIAPGDTLVFVKPGSEAPNVWSLGVLASSY